jgi:hypothetical protein
MHVLLDLLDRWQKPVTVELSIRRDTVETRCAGRMVGIADRDALRGWLHKPTRVFAYDDVAWLDLGHSGVALHVDEMVHACVLRDHVVADLRSRL